jgi:hypothetical protein
MKLIDRIAISRAIQAFLSLVISIIEAFSGKKVDKPEPTPKPLKRVIDKIVPWRKK